MAPDRLTSSTDPAVGTIAYDSHGNTTAIFGESRSYDAGDRHVSTTKAGTTVTYWRDPTGRVAARGVGSAWEEYYTFDDQGDAPAGTLDGVGNLLEADIDLPGGALMTTRSGGNIWSYPNVHGDLVAAASSTGAKQGGTATYDPFGSRVGAVAAVDNSQGAYDYGYLGQHQRGTETQATLQPTIEMGARQYSPTLGRFLEVDPVEGGCANAYVYVRGDPLKDMDLNGRGISKCSKAMANLLKTMFRKKGAVARYLAGSYFRDGDPGHAEAYRNELRSVRRARNRMSNDCGRGKPPPGAGLMYSMLYDYANQLLRNPCPGTGGFKFSPIHVVFGVAVGAAIVATDGAAAPLLFAP